MKLKTIKKTIQSKLADWVASIDDPRVAEVVQNNAIFTGGCIASMLLREPVNDFDVYFRTKEATITVANYYITKFKTRRKEGIECPISLEVLDDRVSIVVKSSGLASEEGTMLPYQYFEGQPAGKGGEYVDAIMNPATIEETHEDLQDKALATDDEDGQPKYRPVFLTTNAITLSNMIQVVIRFYGEPDQIHENYDFTHCTNYYSSWDEKLVIRQAALESLITKELRYVGSKYPVCSIIRLRKFIARGWTINAGQILKMIMQVNELDLTDYNVLKDQLTGVDCAYFAEVLAKLREKDPEKLNAAYLVEIIDRMF